MRRLLPPLFVILLASELHAQAVKFESVRVGFQAYEGEPGRSKVGLWTPVFIAIEAGPDGVPGPGKLRLEATDNEDVGTVFTTDLPPLGKNEKRRVVSYVKPLRGNLRVKVENAAGVFAHGVDVVPTDLGGRLYLTLNGKLPDLPKALEDFKAIQPEAGGERLALEARVACFNDEVALLPTHSFAYEGLDLAILLTGDRKYLSALGADEARLRALAGWIQRGGRLVVAIAPENQETVAALLRASGWTPPLPVDVPAQARPVPVMPPQRPKDPLPLSKVAEWANLSQQELQAERGRLADLGTPGVNLHWDVLASLTAADNRPLIARLPYGLGSITFFAFDFQGEPLSTFRAKKEFLRNVIVNLETTGTQRKDKAGSERQLSYDLVSQLQRTLDDFDVPVISFGLVALLIVLYIGVIGPIDYFLLKKLNRLEWTWFTFPAVVVLAGGGAYLAAASLKNRELKVNKVDLVDFDLRTGADASGRPVQAHAYGHTWFTLLSPRAQNYTLGIEPALADWGLAELSRPNQPARSADLVEWLGRPDPDGPGSYGRTRSTFLRRPYEYAEQGQGLLRVPIPVWTSKSFHASWDMPLATLPFQTDLVFHPAGETKVSGKIENKLPTALTDVWVFYRGRCSKLGDLASGASIDLALREDQPIQGWAGAIAPLGGASKRGELYDSSNPLKWILFHGGVDDGRQYRNHSLRPLDLSWRLKERITAAGVQAHDLRDLVLFARVARRTGPSEEVARSKLAPTALWLGRLPHLSKKADQPIVEGTTVQDTYIRVIIPVRHRN